MLLCASRLQAQLADPLPLPPPPPAPPGVVAPVAASPAVAAAPAPQTVPPTLSVPVRAPTSPPPSAPTRAVADRNWYGWQLLINDFVALGSLGAAAVAGVHDKALFAVIIPVAIVYDLGGPTIHWLHQRRSIAGASFGVRAGVPGIGVLVGMALASCGNANSSGSQACRSRGGGYGALGGFAVATALDAALFGWDAPQRELPRAGLALTPTLTPLDGGAAAGVVGTF